MYRALNRESGHFVAIKEIPQHSMNPSHLQAVQSEIELLHHLQHPQIVRFYETIRTAENLYLVLEYVENGSLANILKHFGRFPEHILQVYMHQVLQGLEWLHSKGVCHRDIKGANLLITKDGQVKLADFGVAGKLTDEAKPHAVVGTPYWMAPEMIEMSGFTTASDIWSLGCTLIELFHGEPPYFEMRPVTALYRIVQDEKPPLPPGLSSELTDFLNCCFVRDPLKRPTAAQLRLHPWLADEVSKELVPALRGGPFAEHLPAKTPLPPFSFGRLVVQNIERASPCHAEMSYNNAHTRSDSDSRSNSRADSAPSVPGFSQQLLHGSSGFGRRSLNEIRAAATAERSQPSQHCSSTIGESVAREGSGSHQRRQRSTRLARSGSRWIEITGRREPFSCRHDPRREQPREAAVSQERVGDTKSQAPSSLISSTDCELWPLRLVECLEPHSSLISRKQRPVASDLRCSGSLSDSVAVCGDSGPYHYSPGNYARHERSSDCPAARVDELSTVESSSLPDSLRRRAVIAKAYVATASRTERAPALERSSADGDACQIYHDVTNHVAVGACAPQVFGCTQREGGRDSQGCANSCSGNRHNIHDCCGAHTSSSLHYTEESVSSVSHSTSKGGMLAEIPRSPISPDASSLRNALASHRRAPQRAAAAASGGGETLAADQSMDSVHRRSARRFWHEQQHREELDATGGLEEVRSKLRSTLLCTPHAKEEGAAAGPADASHQRGGDVWVFKGVSHAISRMVTASRNYDPAVTARDLGNTDFSENIFAHMSDSNTRRRGAAIAALRSAHPLSPHLLEKQLSPETQLQNRGQAQQPGCEVDSLVLSEAGCQLGAEQQPKVPERKEHLLWGYLWKRGSHWMSFSYKRRLFFLRDDAVCFVSAARAAGAGPADSKCFFPESVASNQSAASDISAGSDGVALPAGVERLIPLSSIRNVHVHSKVKFEFELVCISRSYRLRAPSAQALSVWVKTISAEWLQLQHRESMEAAPAQQQQPFPSPIATPTRASCRARASGRRPVVPPQGRC